MDNEDGEVAGPSRQEQEGMEVDGVVGAVVVKVEQNEQADDAVPPPPTKRTRKTKPVEKKDPSIPKVKLARKKVQKIRAAPEEEGPREPINPLLMDHVLETVLDNLGGAVGPLLNLRRVCQDWASVITKYYVKKRPRPRITFGGAPRQEDPQNQNVRRADNGSGKRKLGKFLKDFKKFKPTSRYRPDENSSMIFSNFEFSFNPKFFIAGNQAGFFEFIEGFSTQLTSVRVDVGVDWAMDFTQLIDKQVDFNNLKRLKIFCNNQLFTSGVAAYNHQRANSTLNEEQRYIAMSTLLQKILSAAPILTSVEYRLPIEFRPEWFPTPQNSLSLLANSFQPQLALEELSVLVSPSVLSLLQRKENKSLKRISVNWDYFPNNFGYAVGDNVATPQRMAFYRELNAALLDFLKAQERLERLKIVSKGIEEFHEFPVLPTLKVLEVPGNKITQLDFFGKTFPKLEVLKLNYQSFNGSEGVVQQSLIGEDRQSTYPSVKEIYMYRTFHYYNANPSATNNLIEKMGLKFPSLAHLTITLTSKDNIPYLEGVFHHIRQLKSLSIKFPKGCRCNIPIDSVLTGIDPDMAKNLIRSRKFLKSIDNPAVDALFQDNVARRVNITNLTELERLKISGAESYAFILTEVSAHYGFLQLPKLKVLTLDENSISEDYREKLGKQMKLKVIRRPGGVDAKFHEILLRYFD